jgi:hypothetical protein
MAETTTTRFLANEQLWQEIQSRVAAGKHILAAVAYFGTSGATLLPLKDGDSILLDMSPATVRQGITNPHAVRTLFERGVRVFTRGSLHAKFLVIDDLLIASSANASTNSKEFLDEAGILTTDTLAVRRATEFFNLLCIEKVGKEYLDRCIKEYRPPVFTPAVELHAIQPALVIPTTNDERTAAENEAIRAVHAYEKALFKKHGRRQQATYTRRKIAKDGIIKAIEHAVTRTKAPAGFTTLKEMGLADLSYEAVVLRHPTAFSDKARKFSAERLAEWKSSSESRADHFTDTAENTFRVIGMLNPEQMAKAGTKVT